MSPHSRAQWKAASFTHAFWRVNRALLHTAKPYAFLASISVRSTPNLGRLSPAHSFKLACAFNRSALSVSQLQAGHFFTRIYSRLFSRFYSFVPVIRSRLSCSPHTATGLPRLSRQSGLTSRSAYFTV